MLLLVSLLLTGLSEPPEALQVCRFAGFKWVELDIFFTKKYLLVRLLRRVERVFLS